jgi:DNA-binding winged helix-turn-helix (wHTH) protein/tetratricopeptide (TPR) repeat protein
MTHAFGEFEVDDRLYELRRRGERVRIEPKAFDLLRYLIANRHRVVTRGELLEKLWPAEHVSASALKYCVKVVRKAVGDDGAAQRVIQTVQRRGYRFIAEMREAAVAGEPHSLIIDERPSEQRATVDLPRRETVRGLIGRAEEMSRLRAALASSLSSQGRLVLLSGESGIGKTRTAEEIAREAGHHGALALFGRCYEGQGAPAFWPWVQIIRSYAEQCEATKLLLEMGTGAADVGQVVGAVREKLGLARDTSSASSEESRFRFFDSVTRFLRNASHARALLLVLDDLHWADQPSLRLLEFLAANLSDTRLLVVGTYRDREFSRDQKLAETLGAFGRLRVCEKIPLRGLSEEATRDLITAISGQVLSDALVKSVARRTEGNPFFVQEILRHLIEEGIVKATGSANASVEGLGEMRLPETVRVVIARRFARLSDDCRRMLAVASTIGREFRVALLESVGSHVAPPILHSRLLECLAEAESAEIIKKQRGSIGRHAFTHGLMRETLYDSLMASEQARFHELVGKGLEELFQSDLESHAAELAHHFLQVARVLGRVDEAVSYSVLAARQADEKLAYEEAARHYENALLALNLETRRDEARNTRLFLALGNAHWRSGNAGRAREVFWQCAELARRIGDPHLLGRAALGFGRVQRMTGVADEPLVLLLEETLGGLKDEQSPFRARVMARLARALYPLPQSRKRRVSLIREAIDLARRINEPATLSWVLSQGHWALWAPDNVDERLAMATELVDRATKSGSKEEAMQAHSLRFIDLLELGRGKEADTDLSVCAELAESLRQPRLAWYVSCLNTMRALLHGRLSDAESLIEQTLRAGDLIDSETAHHANGLHKIVLEIERRDHADISTIESLAERYPGVPMWRAVRVHAYAQRRRADEALRALSELARDGFFAVPFDINWLTAMTFIAEGCYALGSSQHAAQLYDLLEPYARRCVVTFAGMACFGSVSRPLGLLAVTLGRWNEAIEHFKVALKVNAAIGAEPRVARTKYDYARALLLRNQPGDCDGAMELLAEAAQAARKIGMRGLLERTTSLSEGSWQRPSNR